MAAQADARSITPRKSRAKIDLRGRIERAIERLLAALDAMDGDCEDEGAEHDGREPEEDLEPSLGSVGSSYSVEASDQRLWAQGEPVSWLIDREEEHDGAELTGRETHGEGWGFTAGESDDDEPSLAHTNHFNQADAALITRGGTAWGTLQDADLELQCEDEGAQVDDEPRCAPNLSPVF